MTDEPKQRWLVTITQYRDGKNAGRDTVEIDEHPASHLRRMRDREREMEQQLREEGVPFAGVNAHPRYTYVIDFALEIP